MEPLQYNQNSSTVSSAHAGWLQVTKILLLLMVCASVLFINIGGWDLWNPDEPRYAEVAREMYETGNYLVPHLNSKLYPDKPPLFFWLIALFSQPLGDVTEVSARLPSAVAALLVIMLTCFLGRKLYDPATGLMAGFILFTAVEFFWLALRANIDMTLTLWTTLSLFLFWRGYNKVSGRRIYYILSYLMMGLGVLTKGPVGFFIPFLTIAVFLIAKREYSKFKEIELFKGILIVLCTAALWIVPASIAGGPAYTHEILFKQTLGRTVDSFSHKRSFFYYLVNFPPDFLPWTLFIPGAFLYFWRQRKKQEKANGLLFPLVWFCSTFIFFSLISGKRSLYLLPLYPAAALLLARFFSGFTATVTSSHNNPSRKFIDIPFYLFFGILFLFSIGAFIFFSTDYPFLEDLKAEGVNFYILLGYLCAGGLLGLFLLRRKPAASVPVYFTATIMTGSFFFSVLSVNPVINNFKSPRPFCSRIDKIVGTDDKLVLFHTKPEDFNYYLRRSHIPVIRDYPTIKKILNSPEKVYAIVQKKYYKKASNEEKKGITILDESRIGHRTYYLIINRASNTQKEKQDL